MQVSFVSRKDQSISPDRVSVQINGKSLPVEPSAQLTLPISSENAVVELQFKKRFFQTPEEPESYFRTYFISGIEFIELREYERVCATLTESKKNLAFWRKQKDGYKDFLINREDVLRKAIVSKLSHFVKRPRMFALIEKCIESSTFLKKSLGRTLRVLKAGQSQN